MPTGSRIATHSTCDVIGNTSNSRLGVQAVGLGDLPWTSRHTPPHSPARSDLTLPALMHPGDNVEHTQDADVLTDTGLVSETDQLIAEGAVVRPQGRRQRGPEGVVRLRSLEQLLDADVVDGDELGTLAGQQFACDNRAAAVGLAGVQLAAGQAFPQLPRGYGRAQPRAGRSCLRTPLRHHCVERLDRRRLSHRNRNRLLGYFPQAHP